MARVLRTDRALDRMSLGALLSEDVGKLIAFFVSFLVISCLWLSHHGLFEATRSASARTDAAWCTRSTAR